MKKNMTRGERRRIKWSIKLSPYIYYTTGVNSIDDIADNVFEMIEFGKTIGQLFEQQLGIKQQPRVWGAFIFINRNNHIVGNYYRRFFPFAAGNVRIALVKICNKFFIVFHRTLSIS